MRRRGERSGRAKTHALVAVALLSLVTLALMECAARGFWRLGYGIPLSRPDTVLYAVYPELWQLGWKGSEYRARKPVRILLLAGSVMHPAWGSIEQTLRERLASHLRRPIVVLNMASIGHTSRDSLVKYEAMARERFDLVVVYHGINDARANVVPPGRFRADYSHYAWYDAVEALRTCPRASGLLLPCTLRFLAVAARNRLGLVEYVGMDAPRRDWRQYGADIKSEATFQANLEAIVLAAHERGDPVLLMTFAAHIPADYSPEAFAERRLDYTLHLSPLEMWGEPAHVVAAIDRHNSVVRSIARNDTSVGLVDQATRMARAGVYYNDVCHLTTAGSVLFVENMYREIAERLRSRR